MSLLCGVCKCVRCSWGCTCTCTMLLVGGHFKFEGPARRHLIYFFALLFCLVVLPVSLLFLLSLIKVVCSLLFSRYLALKGKQSTKQQALMVDG